MYLTFENSFYLWFLFSIPLFIISHFYFLKRSKSKALKFANFEALKRVSGERLLTKNMTHLVLRLMTIFCLIIAIAGTTYWYEGRSNTISYVIALDTSASMTSEDIKPSRFEAAKDYIKVFVNSFDSRTRFGLLGFAGVTTIEKLPTDSNTNIIIAIDKMSISETGGTDISGAIITGTNMLLSEENNGRSIVIVSDGINTVGAFISDPIKESVKYAKLNQVVIHSIGLGTDSGPIGYLPEYYNISSYYNSDLLSFISDETGGVYVYAESTNSVVEAFQYLKNSSEKTYLKFDLSLLAMILVLALLFIEWGLSNTLYRRVL